VLINKALIEIPPKFRDRPPVHPSLQTKLVEARGAEGLAADVRAYGQWMRDEAEKRIGHLYPKATLPDGSQATVIAWIWARTVTCPNPRVRHRDAPRPVPGGWARRRARRRMPCLGSSLTPPTPAG
jgi:putative DNA methylase